MENNINLRLPKPHKTQQIVLDAFKTTRFITMCCGRRWGKSLISKTISIIEGLQGKHIAYVTPQYRLAKRFFKEIINQLPQGIYEANKSDLTIEFISGGTISFFSGENLDALRGGEYDVLIIDEASFIADLEEGWKNALRPLLTKTKGKALFISTPRGKDYFFELTKKANDNGDWRNFQFTTYDNPHIDPQEIDNAKADLPSESFNQEYLAVAGSNKNGIVSLDVITRNTIKEYSTEPTAIIGIDVASTTDYTSITFMSASGKMTDHVHFQSNDWVIVEEKIKALPQDIMKVMDITGVGKVVYDNLINQGVLNLMGFTFTAQSKPQLIKELILALEKDKLKFNELTANELSTFEYKLGKGGHVTYNAISSCHDDTVVSLALCNKFLPDVQHLVNDNPLSKYGW